MQPFERSKVKGGESVMLLITIFALAAATPFVDPAKVTLPASITDKSASAVVAPELDPANLRVIATVADAVPAPADEPPRFFVTSSVPPVVDVPDDAAPRFLVTEKVAAAVDVPLDEATRFLLN